MKNYDEAWLRLRPTIKASRFSGASFEDTAETLKMVSRALNIDAQALPRVVETILAGGFRKKFYAKKFMEHLPDVLPTAVRKRGYTGVLGLEEIIADLQTVRGHAFLATEAVDWVKAFYSEVSSEEFRQRLEEAGYDVTGALEDADKTGANKGTALLNLIAGDVLANPGLIPKLFPNEQSAAAAKAILLNPEEWRRNRPRID
ncbi:hypothetical protein [Stappia indica]|uniref:hypothetical protein n=1 Tax=Stappia indica TaxID=538381 RepID=UPI001CD55023|nr:hypothetical protein [Stappia indica]MCA1299406.1 hypothetical protein [Stappia indica]